MAEFQNPQQEPGTERRLLLVFALTFLVIMLFQPLMKKYGPQPPAPKPEASQPQNPPTAQPQAQALPAAGMAAPSRSSTSKGAAAAPATKQASSESETVIENDLYRIVFTNRGGQVKSWVLKKYKDKPDGNPLELVNKVAAEKYGYPLSLWLYDESLRAWRDEIETFCNGRGINYIFVNTAVPIEEFVLSNLRKRGVLK